MTTAYNERDEWRAACDDDWRSELPARPANDPTEPPYELRGVEVDG